MDEKQKLGQNGLFEETEVIIHMPYNIPVKRVFDSLNFDVKSFERSGDKPIIIIRYQNNEQAKNK